MEEVTHARVISAEPDTLFDELEEVAHAHAVSVELDALLGESEILEEVVCAPRRARNCAYSDAPQLHDDWANPLFEEEMACAFITPPEQEPRAILLWSHQAYQPLSL